MSILFKTFWIHFIKTYFGIILSVILPVVLLLILGHIFKIQYVLPGVIALSIMSLGIISLPISIMELKSSIILKFVGSTKMSKMKFIITLGLFYIFISFLATILIILMTFALFSSKTFPHGGFKEGVLSGIFSLSGSISFIISILIHIVFSVSVGFIIASFSKSILQSMAIGITILLVSMFLSGMIIPVDVIARSTLLQWISRIVPFRYSTGNIIIASTPLPQTSDILEQMSIQDKWIMFKHGNIINIYGDATLDATSKVGMYIKKYPKVLANIAPGDIVLLDSHKHLVIIHTYDDLMQALKSKEFHPTSAAGGHVQDAVLFNLIFDNDSAKSVVKSGNNVFSFQEWGVKKLLVADEVKSFVKDYFKSDPNNSKRYETIAKAISQGDFRWLNLFFSMTKVLYFKADRVLNIFLPILLSGGFIFISSKKFSWSYR